MSEALRADCARFLNEQRRLIGFRRDLATENAAWVPGRMSDSACPDLTTEGRGAPAAQPPPPNSRAAHAGQLEGELWQLVVDEG